MQHLSVFAQDRAALLKRIVDGLQQDERCVAAWLTGSFGRGEADSVSDLDVNVAVRNAAAVELCQKPWIVAGKTAPARQALFGQFGAPVIIHDNHHNAPPEGTFTYVCYAESAQSVDWVLLPAENVERPFASQLLFEKTPIPIAPAPPPETLPDVAEKLTEVIAFFWMMAVSAFKIIARQNHLSANNHLAHMAQLVHYIERLTTGDERPFTPLPLLVTTADQITAVRQLCQKIEVLTPQARHLGANTPENANTLVETRLRLLEANE